jgi:hypothetical protein
VPWNAIVCSIIDLSGLGLSGIGLVRLSEQMARALEIGRCVDLHSEPVGLDQADRDMHSGLERAQLLEMFALFEHAARQPDKAL